MSDYTNTFNESTGDTIDTSDFSTEFTAIETAIATKADVDSDTLTNLTIGSGFSGGALILGTEQATTSGTTVDFTSIPSWVKKITVNYEGVSHDGTSLHTLLLGDSGGFETTGYLAYLGDLASASQNVTAVTTRFNIAAPGAAGHTVSGSVVLSLKDATNNTWVASGVLAGSDGSANTVWTVAGTKSLSATLTQIRLTSASADTFDAGSVNILYEG